MEVREIEIDRITISAQNTRKKLDAGQEDSSLEDLAASIREKGLLQPVIVRAAAEGYELISGQRRLLACQRIGMRSIPAIVRGGLDDSDATAVSLIENVHRADMAPLDKAHAFQQLSQHYAGDHERVSKETGVSVGTIRKYLSLLALPPELQERLSTTEGPAKIEALHTLTRMFPDQEQMAEVYEQIGGFKQDIQVAILRESGGDTSKIPELTAEAMEGAFNTRTCRGLRGKFMCEYIPGELADTVIDFVERYKTGKVPLKQLVKSLR
jgi:ParB/RepB/Spo0J family partition protein